MTDLDPILVDLYQLDTPEMQEQYRAIEAIVERAIEQIDSGMVADVELQIADLVRKWELERADKAAVIDDDLDDSYDLPSLGREVSRTTYRKVTQSDIDTVRQASGGGFMSQDANLTADDDV